MIDIKINDAVILAAGRGSRLKKERMDCSKPMMYVRGKPLITYAIDSLLECGIGNIYIIYHDSSSDLLLLKEHNKSYADSLRFVEDTEQSGALNTFYYAKNHVQTPFILTFSDIIIDVKEFRKMITTALNIYRKSADLMIQTVCQPLIPFEKPLLVNNEKMIVEWSKDGVAERMNCQAKHGGMVYLWFSNPFELAEEELLQGNNSFSIFLQKFIKQKFVYEMEIGNLWDVDTLEDLINTEMLLMPIIALVAPICSGKTEVLSYLRRKNFEGIDVGRFLYELFKLDFSYTPRENFTVEIMKAAEEYGMDNVALRILDELKSLYKPGMKGFVLCGLREKKLMKAIENASQSKLIKLFIKSDMLSCFSRIGNRPLRTADPISLDAFTKTYEADMDIGIKELVTDCEFDIVENNSTIEYLFLQIDSFLRKYELMDRVVEV